MNSGRRHQVSRKTLSLCAAALLLCSFAGCSGSEKETFARGAPQRDAVDTVRGTDLRARFPSSGDGGVDNSRQSYEPMLFPGSDAEQAPAPDRKPRPDYRMASAGYQMASADGVSIGGGGAVEINFERADIQSVAKTLLGDTLGINVVVDPRVQGNVTLAATGPIPRKDVLPVFESALRMSNVAVVREGNLVKIMPVSEAAGMGTVEMGDAQSGFGVSVVPLRYISASAVAKTAENFLARPGALKVDPARNLVLIQGTTTERQAALDVVAAFDVEWMRNQSVGVYPLKSTSPENMIRELERVFESGEGGLGQGVVRFQPVSRMNAVMVVAKSPKFLEQATHWVQRLDRSDNSGTTVRAYRLKNGRAPQVAKILNDIFVAQRSGQSAGDTPSSQIAPGTNPAQSRLDGLRTASATGGIGGAPGGGTTTMQGAGGPATPIAAAFESFERGDREGEATNASIASGTAAARGVFQNVRITADAADNSILVYSNQEDYRVIERSLREIDRPKLQVAIDATVAEVTLTDELQYGVRYFFTSKDVGAGRNNGSVGLLSAATPATASAAVTGLEAAQSALQSAFIQRVLPGFNLLLGPEAQPRVILSALSALTDVKILSAPSLVVMDNQPALLQVGDLVPISTGTATVLSSAATPVVNTIEMRNTGVILKVWPRVHANGTIQLEIEQEISNVVNPGQQTLTPTISQRRVHSTVAVTNGQTVLLGGLISDQTQKTREGIPILNDINVIGNLFGSTTASKRRSEIIMFIKPQLVRNSVDARGVAEEFRDKLEMMRAASPIFPVK